MGNFFLLHPEDDELGTLRIPHLGCCREWDGRNSALGDGAGPFRHQNPGTWNCKGQGVGSRAGPQCSHPTLQLQSSGSAGSKVCSFLPV